MYAHQAGSAMPEGNAGLGQIVPDQERTAAVAQVVDFTGLELFPAQTAFEVRQIVHREFLIIAKAR